MAAMQPAMSHHAMQHGYAQGHMYGVDAAVDPAMAGMGMHATRVISHLTYAC